MVVHIPSAKGQFWQGKRQPIIIAPSHWGRGTIEFDEEGIQPIENLEPLDATGPGLDWNSHDIVIECVFQRCHFICWCGLYLWTDYIPIPQAPDSFRTLTLKRLLNFWATIASNGSLCAMGPLSCLPVSNVGVLWPSGWMDQDATWFWGRPRPQATLC